MQIIYRIAQLHCPRCAVEIEKALRNLDFIEDASLSFATRQLHLTVHQTENLLEQVQFTASRIDPEIKILERDRSGHHHARDQVTEYARKCEKFTCSDPACNCCAYRPEEPEKPEEMKKIPENPGNLVKFVYDVENIDCANCAAKIESAIRKMDGIASANLSYATKQLHLTAIPDSDLLHRIQQVTDKIESGVVYTVHENKIKKNNNKNHAHEHNHEHDSKTEKIKNSLLILGAVLFVIGMILDWTVKIEMLSGGILFLAYLLMGWEVLYNSCRSIRKGQIFDENFLMSIATIGALCIGSVEEAAGVMLFFQIGELFEHIAVERSRKSVMDAIDMRPETVQKICSPTEIRTVPAEEIRPGDRILIRAGDRIPVDGIVRKGEGNIDTSAITGESLPVSVGINSEIMSGCMNLNGVLELEATTELENSMVSRILESVESAAAGKPKIDKFITRFARIYTPIVVAIAILTAIVPSLITGNWSYWVYAALNFLMISCPCALVLSVPLAFFSGIGAGSVHGILFKDGISLEALAGVKAVVMDKTGTLTKGNFVVTQAETVHCKTEELFRMCAACESSSTHPVAKSILQYMEEQQITYQPAENIRELAGRGIMGVVNQMQVACGNEKLMQELEIDYPTNQNPAGTCVYVAVDGIYYGRLVLSDTPKEHALQTVTELNRKNLYTVMLTGDSSEHTKAIAEKLQVREFHAGLLPTEKPVYMQKVRESHGAVLFVGDGINDAPVLSGADVGAAMGSGADAAMEVADLVLLGSDPASVVTAFEIAQRVNQTSKFCIVFALAVKIAIMILAFFGFANMWLSVFADTGVTILCVIFVLIRVHTHTDDRYLTNVRQ